MENKKNTILLTVIAVATLLVAVVGATFAYFTAQGGSASKADVVVQTGKAGSSSMAAFDPINIYADATNFNQTTKQNRTGSTTGEVKWTAPTSTAGSTVSEADRSFCYTATLSITNNTFVVSSTNTTGAAELTFSAKRNSDILVENQDITTVGNNGAATSEHPVEVKIPTTKGGDQYTFKLLPNAGESITDTWTLTATLVNLEVDQNDNTGKSFAGAVKFTKVNCQ